MLGEGCLELEIREASEGFLAGSSAALEHPCLHIVERTFTVCAELTECSSASAVMREVSDAGRKHHRS